MNAEILRDPQGFLSTVTLNLYSLAVVPSKTLRIPYPELAGVQSSTKSSGNGYFDLIPMRKPQVDLRSVGPNHQPKGDAALYAYYVGYVSVGSGLAAPTVLIPKQASSPRFVFTGPLQGCSIIVEDVGANFRVTHDPRPNSSGHYPNHVAAIDFNEYTTGTMTRYVGANHEAVGVAVHEQVGAAAVGLFYADGRWVLFGQVQEWDAPIIIGTGSESIQQNSVRTVNHIWKSCGRAGYDRIL
jgi:hypothetical protein